jgi:hypothetical protein
MPKRFLEHGKFRMLEVLKQPDKLGKILDHKDWEILESMEFPLVKHMFYKHVPQEEIRKLEKVKFKLDNRSK